MPFVTHAPTEVDIACARYEKIGQDADAAIRYSRRFQPLLSLEGWLTFIVLPEGVAPPRLLKRRRYFVSALRFAEGHCPTAEEIESIARDVVRERGIRLDRVVSKQAHVVLGITRPHLEIVFDTRSH